MIIFKAGKRKKYIMKHAGAMDQNEQCQSIKLNTNHIKNTEITNIGKNSG
jgi:hypothetical protein